MGRKGEHSKGRSFPQHEIQGFIAEGTVLAGELVLEGGYRVDGRVVGKLTSTSTLIVGPQGEIEAEDLRVSTLLVSGIVRGTLYVEERLEIHRGGKVYGTVTLSKPGLVVDPGGAFEGKLLMAGVAKG